MHVVNLSLYIHIPFCRQRCGYCDFVTFAGFERLIPAYLDALKRQVVLMGNGASVQTIYFGGGTPSLIPANAYKVLFETIKTCFSIDPYVEISLEANPGTVDLESLTGYREAGFNRISFGMQSANVDELALLDRLHTQNDVQKAVENARNAGFSNINLDLIYGLPGQTLKDWQYSLEAALEFKPEHLSLYSLIVEEDTPLAKKIQAHLVPEPDDDTAAEQYEWSCALLEKCGYAHYELSNWALSSSDWDYRCKHNLQYWKLQPYIGFGCGAVGFFPADSEEVNRAAFIMENERWITRYIQQVNQASRAADKTVFLRQVSPEYEMETRLFMGFRLLQEGIDPQDFRLRFQKDVFDVFGSRLERLISENLVEIAPGGIIRLTRKAWLVANRVFREFAYVTDD